MGQEMICNQSQTQVFVDLFGFSLKYSRSERFFFFQRVTDYLKTPKFHREEDIEDEGQTISNTEPGKAVAHDPVV